MHGAEVEQFHHTRGIHAFVTAKACRHWVLRIMQINESNRELAVRQFLVSEFGKGGACCLINEILQSCCIRHRLWLPSLLGFCGNQKKKNSSEDEKRSYSIHSNFHLCVLQQQNLNAEDTEDSGDDV